MQPDFNFDEVDLMIRVAERVDSLNMFADGSYPRIIMVLDLAAVNGYIGMDFEALLNADDFNFAHDIVGIRNHLDRETGRLGNCFLPRFIKKVN